MSFELPADAPPGAPPGGPVSEEIQLKFMVPIPRNETCFIGYENHCWLLTKSGQVFIYTGLSVHDLSLLRTALPTQPILIYGLPSVPVL